MILTMILTIFLPPERNSKANHNMQELWEARTSREIWKLMTRMTRLSSRILKTRERCQTAIWKNQTMIMSGRLIKGIIPPWVTQLQWATRAKQQSLLSIVSL